MVVRRLERPKTKKLSIHHIANSCVLNRILIYTLKQAKFRCEKARTPYLDMETDSVEMRQSLL